MAAACILAGGEGGSQGEAIERVRNEAEVPRRIPKLLRHNEATAIRQEYALEAAQVMLGHSSADITQAYAERDRTKRLKITGEVGQARPDRRHA